MKKLLIFCIALVAFGSINAQENVVKVNPLGLLFGSANAGYERVLNESSAVELSVNYTSIKTTVGVDADAKATGFGFGAGYKLYFSKSKTAPRGWYGEPNVSYAMTSAKSGNSEGKINMFAVGALGGYQWVFGGNDSGFALDLGLGFNYINATTSGDINDAKINGIVPALKLALGYAF